MKRILPAALSLSLAAAPVLAYADTEATGPGAAQNDPAMERLKDNVLEYDEIEGLVDTYNTTLQNMRSTYKDKKDSLDDIDDVRETILDQSNQLQDVASMLSSSADQMELLIGMSTGSMGGLGGAMGGAGGLGSVGGLGGGAVTGGAAGGGIQGGGSATGGMTGGGISGAGAGVMGGSAMGSSIAVTYADLVYASALMESQGEQLALSADSLSRVTPEMFEIQMIDTPRAALISGAQQAVNGYEQIQLQKKNLDSTIELLEAVYQSTERQAQAGLATPTDVITAKQNLDSVRAGRMALESTETSTRQSICTLLGWQYQDVPDIRPLPSADLIRIDAMNLAADTQTAINNNFTLKYNRLNQEILTPGSAEMENIGRTIKAEEAEIGSSMVNLYNSVLQARNDYQSAQDAWALAQTQMAAAERKMSLGMIGRLEYLQQKNAHQSAEVSVRTAELSLIQAIETYDWAVKGNLTLQN